MGVITDPDQFFAETVERDQLRESLYVLLVAAACMTSSIVVRVFFQFQILPNKFNTFVAVGGLVAVLIGILSIVGLWMVYSIIIYYLAVKLGGDGSFRNTISASGYGYLAMIISGVFSGVAMYVTLNQRVSAATEATLSLLEVSPSVSPLLLMSLLITLLCMLWRTIIWIFAIKHTHGITVRKSVFVAVIPTLVAIILTVVGAV